MTLALKLKFFFVLALDLRWYISLETWRLVMLSSTRYVNINWTAEDNKKNNLHSVKSSLSSSSSSSFIYFAQ